MIEVHHLNNSRSQRVLWLLEELEVPYQVIRYQRDKKTMLAPKELRAIHPLGKSPVVKDEETVIAESGAIIEYLVERYGNGRLVPAPGSPERLRYRYWLHYAEGSLMPPLLLKLVVIKLGILGLPARRYVNGQLKVHLRFLESELETRPYFAGAEFSAADIQMSFPLEAAMARAGLDASYPRLRALHERLVARPAYQRALVTGGPFSMEG